jgi:hypothetical protein
MPYATRYKSEGAREPRLGDVIYSRFELSGPNCIVRSINDDGTINVFRPFENTSALADPADFFYYGHSPTQAVLAQGDQS